MINKLQIISRASAWLARRRAVRQLSAADDSILKDMGISRSGIESAVRSGRSDLRR